jgi:hypothetical protein
VPAVGGHCGWGLASGGGGNAAALSTLLIYSADNKYSLPRRGGGRACVTVPIPLDSAVMGADTTAKRRPDVPTQTLRRHETENESGPCDPRIIGAAAARVCVACQRQQVAAAQLNSSNRGDGKGVEAHTTTCAHVASLAEVVLSTRCSGKHCTFSFFTPPQLTELRVHLVVTAKDGRATRSGACRV